MSALKNLVGQRFGKLVVIERAENAKSGHACFRCRCDCGHEVVVLSNDLRRGHTRSCGCLHKTASQRNITHGMTGSRIFKIWSEIKTRCYNPNRKEYKNYGGRGITMYEPWRNDFQAFYDYVSALEHFGEKGYTLDREDNDGNYEPGNLRWATRAEQQRNRRSNVLVEYDGERMTLAEAAERSGISYNTLLSRYQRGDRGEKLFRPLRGK